MQKTGAPSRSIRKCGDWDPSGTGSPPSQGHYCALISLLAEAAERERHLSYWASSGYLDQEATQGLIEHVQQLEARYLETFPVRLKIR